MDTRFWGPSGWQLFHLISFQKREHVDDVLNFMKEILPCRFCRESTTQFVHDHPLRGNPAKWLYDIHNMVNNKLRTQAKDDPSMIDPGPDPSFEEITERYTSMKPVNVPGRDFLFSIAFNYPDKPESEDMCRQRTFIGYLAKTYPFDALRKAFNSHLDKHELNVNSRLGYMRWMYGLLKALSIEIHAKIPIFRGYAHHVAYSKSGCNKKTYHGKTCRKIAGGGYTKQRDHRKTYRIAHKRLL